MREAFRGHLEGAHYRPEVPVVAAALGDDAGLVGAAILARELT
jgi:glucokinase